MSEREMVKVNMICESDSATWPLGKFRALLEKAERLGGDTARVEFQVDQYDGGAWLTISYERPETDEEMERRLSWKREWAERDAASERAQYERLKAKYEAQG